MFGNLLKTKPPDPAVNNQSYTENTESEKIRNLEDPAFEDGIEAQIFFEEARETINAFENGHDNPISSRKMPQDDEPNGTSPEPTKWCLKFEEPCLIDQLDTPSKYQSQAANIEISESENLSQDKDGVSQGCLNEAHEIFEQKGAINSVGEESHAPQYKELCLDVKPQSNGPQAAEAKRWSQNEEPCQKFSPFYADSSKAESVLGTAQPQLVLQPN